jgi:hypothetical protein
VALSLSFFSIVPFVGVAQSISDANFIWYHRNNKHIGSG